MHSGWIRSAQSLLPDHSGGFDDAGVVAGPDDLLHDLLVTLECRLPVYWPVKMSARLSTNAFAASRWSSVRPVCTWCTASISSSSAKPLLSAQFRLRFISP